MDEIPYGAWPSPISAADVAAGSLALSFPAIVEGEIWWTEGRPADDGRQLIVRADAGGTVSDVLPPPWSAATRVHEMGGRSWLPLPGADGTTVVFANADDQQLYRLDQGSVTPAPLTPAGSGDRFAELVLGADGTEVWCVRESHRDGAVSRALVAVPLDGGPTRVLVTDGHFLTFLRISPDGRWLAWVSWDHPQMPWDGTRLRVAPILPDGTIGRARTLLGGPEESVLQPEWADDGHLYALSDRSGWWNLYRISVDGGEPDALCPREEEFGGPLWNLGASWYAVLPDQRIVVRHGVGSYRVGILDPAAGTITDWDVPFVSFEGGGSDGGICTDGTTVAFVAGGPGDPLQVVRMDLATGRWDTVRSAIADLPDRGYLPAARTEHLTVADGRVVHAQVYPPTNKDVRAPANEAPPYVVRIHGGPTSQAKPLLDLEVAYFTSRGIGILDVDHGGSTGYGRAYRNLLRGQWGVRDVDDTVGAATAFALTGAADPDRLAITGRSAGGWTTLCALVRSDAFACGVSRWGIADLVPLATDTHDFESRYLDSLVGPLPAARDLFDERSPLNHVDSLTCPVLLLQGADDPIVPPNQAELFATALAEKGIPHTVMLFPGERHGLTKATSIVSALEAEFAFYAENFGFQARTA